MRSISLAVLVFILSCNNEAGNKTPASFNTSRPGIADSIELLYFKDPDGDSLRYTRFFTYLSTKDTSIVSKLAQNLQQPFEKLDSVKPCRSEGKIYAHEGAETVKTIFFSTRCDSCCYLYYIKNGKFLYFKLSGDLKSELMKKKAYSAEPKSG